MSREIKLAIGLILFLVIFGCCCVCFLPTGLMGYIFDSDNSVSTIDIVETEIPSPTDFPTEMLDPPTETEENISDLNYQKIVNTVVNQFNVLDVVRMFEGITNIPEYYIDTDAPYDVGDEQNFWIINTDTNTKFETTATLQYETVHVYFWIENDVYYDNNDLQNLSETFENQIYQTNRDFFGSEFFPGIDQDPHIFILYVRNIGRNVAGLFSSSDSIHPMAIEYSNGHESFYINADNQNLGDDYTYGVLSHEFQHMIHWYQDRNEASWLNEGFSELAVLLNGQNAGYFDYYFLQDTDIQLNTWPDDNTSTSHYGASLLFVTYLYDRMGVDVTKALVAHQDNGLQSIDKLMIEENIIDDLTGEIVEADELVLDWAVANYLMDENVDDGRYAYYSYQPDTSAATTIELNKCPDIDLSDSVHQYGADYIAIRCNKDQMISFSGNQLVDLLPEDAFSGDYAFWSNKGDESMMSLVRKFDFTEQDGDISFTYKIWYDLEADYDYLYLASSSDGENWEIVETPSGTGDDPSGNNYGWGYNSSSGEDGEWIKEIVDISGFAGEEVYLGFMYITDAAVNWEGALIDDIYVPETGYYQDFEDGAGDWEADGFVLVSKQIPQTFELALIRLGKDTSVERLELSPENTIDFEVIAHEKVVLVVVATTRHTYQPAVYNLNSIE